MGAGTPLRGTYRLLPVAYLFIDVYDHAAVTTSRLIHRPAAGRPRAVPARQ
jgi:hypothetical protein